ncbi:MAG: PAS domain S-box protein, partial [Anaerolineae bacterium]|nr:PAS domain S-box protein [Anaerolineae bacterium]
AEGHPHYIQAIVRDISERKQIQKQLQESEARNRTLFEQTNDAVYILDMTGTHIAANHKAADILGYSSVDEIIGLSFRDVVVPDEQEQSLSVVQRLRNGERIAPYERRFRRKNGDIFPVEINVELIRDTAGEPLYLQSIARDITERKKAEAALRERETLYRTLVRNLPNVAVLMFDPNTRHLLAEGAWISRYGYSKETFEGKTLAEAVSDERYQFHLPYYEAALAGKESRYETEREGYIYEVHVVPLRDDEGNIIGGLNISEDITERKQAEATQRRQEALYRALVKNLPNMAVIMFDHDFRYLLVEGQILDRHPNIREKFGGSIWDAFTPERAQFFLPIYQSALAGNPVDYAFDMDGYFYIAHFVPVRDEDDHIVAAMSITEDVTESKRAEDALRRSEERFRTLVENLHIGVLLQGPNAEMLLANEAALDMLGLTRDQLMGKTSLDPDWNVIHEDGSDFPGPTHPVPQAIATGKPVRDVVMGVYRPITKDRVWLLVNAEPEFGSDGSVRQVICTFNDITERKRAQDELKYERDLLQALMDNFPDSIYIKDTQSRFTRVNQAQADMLDASSREAMIGKTDFDFQHPEMAQKLFDEERRLVQTGEPIIDQLEYNLSRDGNSRWFSTTKVPIFDAAGEVIAIAGISRNITARKLTEDALRESERRYHELFEGIDDAIFVHDMVGNILDVNEAACRNLGYSRSELLGMKTTDIDAPEYAAGFAERVHQQRTAGVLNNIGVTHIAKDGRRIDVHINSKLISFRGQPAVLALARDITPLKKAEEIIRYQATLVDHVTDAIYSTDLNETILTWNRAAEQLYGWRADEAIGQFSGRMVGSQMTREDRVTAVQQIRDQGFWEGEIVHTSRSGRIIQAWVSTTLLRDREGNPSGFIAVSRDITERKQAQEALRQSEEKYRQLFSAAQLQAQELTLLNLVRVAVASEMDLGPLIRTVVEAVGEIFGYTYVSLYLLEGDHLVLYHEIGYDVPYPIIPLNKGIIGRTARRGVPDFVKNINDDPEYLAAASNITSEISVPLFDRERTVGVFNVESSEGKQLTNDDLRLMVALSEQISIAIERARLYTSLRESKEQYQNVLSSVREVIFQ